jgi:hypothetical protein
MADTPAEIWKELNRDVNCSWFIGAKKWAILNDSIVSDELVPPITDPTPPPSGPAEIEDDEAEI